MPLAGCYVISLRPVGAHASLRRAAAAQGARVLALSPWRIETPSDAATRRALREALAADIVIATSPAAVRAASDLHALRKRHGQAWCAVGAGTAAALRRAGAPYSLSPGQLGTETLVTSGTMTNRIDRLEERGLVRREPDPSDRRGVRVVLTETGRTTVDDALFDLIAREHDLLATLPDDAQAELAGLLRSLVLRFDD